MPKSLLEKIDEERAHEKFKPSRSAWIVAELTEAAKRSQKMRGLPVAKDFEVAGEKPSAGVGGPSSSSTRIPPLPELQGDPRLNEASLADAVPQKISGPRARSTRAAVKKLVEREKGKSGS